MINSVLKLTGVEANPVYLPRADDVGGKAVWENATYAVKHGLISTSSDAVPSALQGEVFWHDTETTENGEKVYYDPTDTYAYWSDGSTWLISAVADVGGSPSSYFKMIG